MSAPTRIRSIQGFFVATVLACLAPPGRAVDAPEAPTLPAEAANPPKATLSAYRALAAEQARSYDQTQDISPRQLLLLLEVSERTGASLGQALATGEYESARTWNDFVRPTLPGGTLGSAAGVWQFIPSTFHRIIKHFGAQLLAASDADAGMGRARLDLGDGPFTDAQVRRLIQQTVDGERGSDDKELLLLRHNFAVLAFAKHYLSVESGAKTPEEDYLFHFLGATRGREVLKLAQGASRDTLCVNRSSSAVARREPPPARSREAIRDARTILQSASVVAAESALVPQIGSGPQVRISARHGLSSRLQQGGLSSGLSAFGGRAIYVPSPKFVPESAIWSEPELAGASSAWGLSADSPVVTGNPGMFYRDGSGQTQPYTWGEFMDTLARRVRAKDQPALVRAKYGVGFSLNGGDMPARAFRLDEASDPVDYRHEISGDVLLPEKLLTGPLDARETREYQSRLAELIRRGEDRPLAELPPAALSALRHLAGLSPEVQDSSASNPQVRKALMRFRAMVGKDAPDDPDHVAMLLPGERVALAIYDERLGRYAALQAAQQVELNAAIDLGGIRRLPKGLQQAARPHVAVLQGALADAGLLEAPKRKVVWRDKRGKRHVRYEPAPHDGIAGPLTLGALERFQRSHGLLLTDGALDGVTRAILGLPPMGMDIFQPMSGPLCATESATERPPRCEARTEPSLGRLRDFLPRWSRPLPEWWDSVRCEVSAPAEETGSVVAVR